LSEVCKFQLFPPLTVAKENNYQSFVNINEEQNQFSCSVIRLLLL